MVTGGSLILRKHHMFIVIKVSMDIDGMYSQSSHSFSLQMVIFHFTYNKTLFTYMYPYFPLFTYKIL
jgi:hypothetical protein